MINKLFGILVMVGVLAALLMPFGARATTLNTPDYLEIETVRAWQHMKEVDDVLILARFNTYYNDYAMQPPQDISKTFTFTYTDSTGNVTGNDTAYPFFNLGYVKGLAVFYWAADDPDKPTWGDLGNVTIAENPIYTWTGTSPTPVVVTRSFYGYVTLDGNATAVGTLVTAYVGGDKRGQCSITNYMGAGEYGYGLDPLTVVGVAGESVDFYAEGHLGGNYTLSVSGSGNLALVATSAEPTPPPPPSPTPTPTPAPSELATSNTHTMTADDWTIGTQPSTQREDIRQWLVNELVFLELDWNNWAVDKGYTDKQVTLISTLSGDYQYAAPSGEAYLGLSIPGIMGIVPLLFATQTIDITHTEREWTLAQQSVFESIHQGDIVGNATEAVGEILGINRIWASTLIIIVFCLGIIVLCTWKWQRLNNGLLIAYMLILLATPEGLFQMGLMAIFAVIAILYLGDIFLSKRGANG